MTLPKGQYYVCKDGRFLDDRGNVYEYVPASSGTVASPTPKPLPTVTLSESAKRYIASAREVLSVEPVEHFVVFGVDARGHVVSEYQKTDDQPNRCHIEMKSLMQKLMESKSVAAVYALHNHPGASADMSEEDQALTETLRRTLKAYDLHLLKHEAVAGAIEEAEQDSLPWVDESPSLWAIREAQENRLWAAYGGHNPYAR
jgi:proteasome lid subunit RPN8/RPN11